MKDSEITIDRRAMPQPDEFEAIFANHSAMAKPAEVLLDYQNRKKQTEYLADSQLAEHQARYQIRAAFSRLPMQEAQEVESISTSEMLQLGQMAEQMRAETIRQQLAQQKPSSIQKHLLFLRRPQTPKELRNQLILHESAQVGAPIFDEVTNTVEFYCLDAHTWVWSKIYGGSGPGCKQIVRYEVKPEGLTKHVDGIYKPVHQVEAQNLTRAMQYYVLGLQNGPYRRAA